MRRRERAVTQQPADRGGLHVVGASDISLRLATGQPPVFPVQRLNAWTSLEAYEMEERMLKVLAPYRTTGSEFDVQTWNFNVFGRNVPQ